MTVKHVKNDSISLKVYLQKTRLKKKAEQVEEQKLGSKIDLQKVKVEQIEEKSTVDIHIETIFGLPLDPKIHNSKCYIKELQES